MPRISVQTQRSKQVVDITNRVNQIIAQNGMQSGLCGVTIQHTTAAISTVDLDPGTDQDMLDAFTTMIPDLDYRHPHDPAHAPDHILATLVGPSVVLPIENGELVLGTWQSVVLFEFDGPRERNVFVTLLG